MAYFIVALVALGVLMGFTSTQQMLVARSHTLNTVQAGSIDGAQFANFAFTMVQFAEANPSVSGPLTPSLIGGQFTPEFLANVTAWVSPSGVEPRTLICAASLGAGALQAALSYSNGDAAFGTPSSSGTQWVSSTGPSRPLTQSLLNPVTSTSSIVFVVNVQP